MPIVRRMRGVREPGPAATRAVVFSMGALCCCDRADALAATAFRRMLQRFNVTGDARESFGQFTSRFSQVARWYQQKTFYLQGEMLHEARVAGLRALGVQPSEAEMDDLDTIWRDAPSRSMHARPGAHQLLRSLRTDGLAIGITSNADCQEFRGTLEDEGLDGLADSVLCSEEARSCKPDPVIFYEMLRRLDVRPSEALFVGTSPEVDIRGARVVGMRSALLATGPPRWWDTDGFAPDHLISTLNEVATLVTLPAPAGGPRVRRRACAHELMAG